MRFRALNTQILNAIATLMFPVSVGLALVADTFVVVLLGERWQPAAVFLPWLSYYALCTGIIHRLTFNILILIGHERQSAWFNGLRAVALVPFLLLGAYSAPSIQFRADLSGLARHGRDLPLSRHRQPTTGVFPCPLPMPWIEIDEQPLL